MTDETLDAFLRKPDEDEERILSLLASHTFGKSDLPPEKIPFLVTEFLLKRKHLFPPHIPRENLTQYYINSLTFEHPVTFRKHVRFVPSLNHNHPNFLEIGYVYSGTVRQTINGKPLVLEKGDFVLFGCDAYHSVEATGEDDIMINCIINRNIIETGFPTLLKNHPLIYRLFLAFLYTGKTADLYHIFHTAGHPDIESLATLLLKEYFADNRKTPEIVEYLLASVFIKLATLPESQRSRVEARADTAFDSVKFNRILEDEYKTITLAGMAERFGYSPAYFSRLVAQTLQKSFTTLIKDIRMRNARSLIAHTTMSINDIYQELGYTNKTAFYKAFMEINGCTPNQYRAGIRTLMPALP